MRQAARKRGRGQSIRGKAGREGAVSMAGRRVEQVEGHGEAPPECSAATGASGVLEAPLRRPRARLIRDPPTAATHSTPKSFIS